MYQEESLVNAEAHTVEEGTSGCTKLSGTQVAPGASGTTRYMSQ